MRINVWIPDKLLEAIDRYCLDNGLSRSKFLSERAEKILGMKMKVEAVSGIEGEEVKVEVAKTLEDEEFFNPVPKPKK